APKARRSECEAATAGLVVTRAPEITLLSMLAPWALGFAALVVLGIVAGLVRKVLRGRALARKVSLVDGEVAELTGTVRARRDLLEAALSGRACVAHRSHARVVKRTGELVAEVKEDAACAFTLDTASGVVEVAADAVFALVPGPVIPRVAQLEAAFLERHGHG